MDLPKDNQIVKKEGFFGTPPRFEFPETKNPFLSLIRRFGKYSVYIIIFLIIIIYKVFNINSKSYLGDLIFVFLFAPLFISLGWLFLKQKLWAYKFAGWGIILGYIFIVISCVLSR